MTQSASGILREGGLVRDVICSRDCKYFESMNQITGIRLKKHTHRGNAVGVFHCEGCRLRLF
jgi:hypothetical protein